MPGIEAKKPHTAMNHGSCAQVVQLTHDMGNLIIAPVSTNYQESTHAVAQPLAHAP